MSYPAPAAAIISEALLTAPGWARVGLTMPNARLRGDAASELARVVIEHLEGHHDLVEDGQLAFPL